MVAFATLLGGRPVPTQSQTFNLVAVGDSITAGVLLNTIPWPTALGTNLSNPQWIIHNESHSGYRLTDMLLPLGFTEVDPLLLPNASRNIVILWAGVNDAISSYTASTIYAGMIQYAHDRYAAGWTEFWICKETMWGGNPGVNTILTSVNSMLDADHSFANKEVDTLSVLPDPFSAVDFQADHLHPTNAGAQKVANAIQLLL